MKTKTIKLAFTLLFLTTLFFIQSCATSGMSSEKMTFVPHKTPNGLIFGSITFPKEKAKFNGYFLQISCQSTDLKTAKKNSKEIHFSPEQIVKMKHAGDADRGLTYLFAIERPEGDYAVTGIRLFSNSGIQALQRSDYTGGFSIPFKVNKGEITYVGNVVFNEYAGANDTVVSYRNNFEKDLISIKRVQPNVYWDGSKNDTSRKISYVKEL